MRLVVTVALLATACAKQSPTASVGGSIDDATAKSAEEACVDRWLHDHHLDPFGAPEGTVYAGGTPALDETTGTIASRLQSVYARHPPAEQTCRGDSTPASGR